MPIALGQKAVTPMALTPTLLNVSLSATMFLCLPAAIPGQTLPHADDTDASAGRLSEPFHGATYLEATLSNGRQPNWNHGRLVVVQLALVDFIGISLRLLLIGRPSSYSRAENCYL